MKFRNYLESITGIGIYPLISLLLFGTVFILVILYVIGLDKNKVKEIKNLPLE